jgi:hypothetical protein
VGNYPAPGAAILFGSLFVADSGGVVTLPGGGTGCGGTRASWYACGMADTDPVTSPDTDPAYAQGDQDAEPTLTAPPGSRPDAATDPESSAESAEPTDAEGAS